MNILKNKSGGLGIIILILLLVFSFGLLVFGIVKQYQSMKQKEDEISFKIQEVRTEDPKQKEKIEYLEKNLESATRISAELENRLKKATTSSDDFKKRLDNANNQVNYLVSEKERLDKLVSDQIADYEKKLKDLDTQKTELSAKLEEEKSKLQNTETVLVDKVSVLQKELDVINEKNKDLKASFHELSRSKLVQETSKMHFNLATYFLETKRYDLALTEYERAIQLTPYDADAYYNAALIYDVYMGKAAKAVQYYRKCLELDPKISSRQEVQERLVVLTMQEASEISPTFARDNTAHKYDIDTITSPLSDKFRSNNFAETDINSLIKKQEE